MRRARGVWRVPTRCSSSKVACARDGSASCRGETPAHGPVRISRAAPRPVKSTKYLTIREPGSTDIWWAIPGA